jgi:hypothetical protein
LDNKVTLLRGQWSSNGCDKSKKLYNDLMMVVKRDEKEGEFVEETIV